MSHRNIINHVRDLTFLFSQVRSQGHQRSHLPLLSRKEHQTGDNQEEFKVFLADLDQERHQPSGYVSGCAQFFKSYNIGQLSQTMGRDC